MERYIQGSYWFKRLMEDIKSIDPYLRVVRAKMGFYRIYWKQSYVHEIYSECPMIGYDFEIEDPSLESQKYYDELEDCKENTRKLKKYKEGYFDSLDHIKTRVWMLRHDKEFNENAAKRWQEAVVR